MCRTWGQHVLSILYDIICSRTFYSILPSLVINVVITPSDCDWCDWSLLNLTLVVLKIENRKIKRKIKRKEKLNRKIKSTFNDFDNWLFWNFSLPHFLANLCSMIFFHIHTHPLINFLYFRSLQATYQYFQLSRYIIKLFFTYFLDLPQHSVVF